jgi:hypothetical protein
MYNAKEYVESKNAQPGTMIEAVIVNVTDGKPRDFLKTEEAIKKFKNVDGTAIQLTIEGKNEGVPVRFDCIITYNLVDGKIVLKQTSNLGKYKKIYNKLPEVGDKVKILSNAQGYFKLYLG